MSTLREVWQRGAEFLGQGNRDPALDAEAYTRYGPGPGEFYRELTACGRRNFSLAGRNRRARARRWLILLVRRSFSV